MALPKIAAATTKFLVVTLFLLGSFQVFASDARITGTYSSLKYNSQSGDLLGYEILIIPTDTGFKGVVQVAEGAPGQVYVVEILKRGSDISFDMPLGPGVKESFSGHVTRNFLVGDISSSSGKEHIQLKRGISYWDK